MKIALVLAAATTLFFVVPAFAQSGLREFGRGPMAAIDGAMTEAQARAACTRELRAGKNRRIPRDTLAICMRRKMFGPS